ncbi:MAG: hypothetical protein K0R15_182 [Clostridiales bacterium]|jgi:serine protease AprX|nr:hypothetical protein [Clostridiales bacterium]
MAAEEKFVQIIVSCSVFRREEKTLRRIGKVKYELPMINSWVIEVPENSVKNIKLLEGIEKVEIDTHIAAQMNSARNTVNASWAHQNGITGKNIGIAVLDTGVYPHKDFIYRRDRIVAFKDFVNDKDIPYDDNGHGTHVAGIFGGDGSASGGKYCGIAPNCNIIGVKVLDHSGNGNISDLLAGLQWVINNKEKYNIRVVNISVGRVDENKEGEESALVKGVDATWNSGLVVVVAAGNNGPARMSVTTPGISRRIITVGASDDDRQVNIRGNKKVNYSGRGPTINLIQKPDVIAPGSNVVSCMTDAKFYGKRRNPMRDTYTIKSGTSMSTPIVSGAVALLLEKYPDLTNKDVKIKLKDSSIDVGFVKEKQGWGLIDIKELLS